jgi:hypothetical protein
MMKMRIAIVMALMLSLNMANAEELNLEPAKKTTTQSKKTVANTNRQAAKKTATVAKKSSSSNKPTHTLAVNFGPAWITSKMYVPVSYGRYEEKSRKTGTELTAEYNCVFSSCYGFGITYSHNHTGYGNGVDVDLNYIGPSFVMAGNLSPKWRGKLDVGLGYGNMKTGGESEGGLAFKAATGVEYLVSKNFGIGAELMTISTYFGKQEDNYPGDKDDTNGIARLGLNVGMRFYF